MKPILIALVAIVLAPAGAAQDMVEYSHAASKPPVGMQTLTNKTNAAMEKLAGGKSDAKTGPQDTRVAAPPEPAGKPAPPAVFILNNGTRLESSHYTLTSENLTVQDGPAERSFPLSALDRKATLAENQKRGLDLKIPTSQSQMMLSF